MFTLPGVTSLLYRVSTFKLADFLMHIHAIRLVACFQVSRLSTLCGLFVAFAKGLPVVRPTGTIWLSHSRLVEK